MKQLLGSIVFIAIASFSSLAFGQTVWQFGTANSTNVSGNWNNAGSWSGGVPITNESAIVPMYVLATTISGGPTTYSVPNPNITITLTGANVAGQLWTDGASWDAAQLPPDSPYGTINYAMGGATLTLSGNGGLPDTMLFDDGITSNFSGGVVTIQSGEVVVGDSAGTGALNLNGSTFNFGNGTGFDVGVFGTGSMIATSSSITMGSNSYIEVGTFGGNGTFTLNGSGITVGANSEIIVGTGIFTQDRTSTVAMGAGSVIYLGYSSGDSATYALSGSLSLNNSTISIGSNSGATGILNQTSGSIYSPVGTTATLIVGDSGNGTYNFSGGSADFEGGIILGSGGGSGVINQSGTTSLISGAGQVANIGMTGVGIYNLSSGSVDFQGGVTIGSLGTFTQSGGTVTSEGTMTISAGGSYILSNGSTTLSDSLVVNGALNINTGGTLQVDDDQLYAGASGTINLGGGTLKLMEGMSSPTSFNYNFAGSLTGGTSTIDTSNATSVGTFTFANALSGTGGLSLIGNGSTQFYFASNANPTTVNNTYTGSTSINGGQLFATDLDIAANSALNIGATGTVNLALSGSFTYNASGGITGTGLLNVDYAAMGDTLGIKNASNFTGSIVLGANGTQGVLQVFSGTFDNISDNGTGSDVVIGNGTNSGTVTLGGVNTYSGTTTVTTGYTLKAASLDGDVVNNGTLSTLGSTSSPAVLTINDATTNSSSLNSTGNLNVYVNGTTADMYNVTGSSAVSTLSGTVVVTGAGTKTYTIVQTAGDGHLLIGGNGNVNDSGGLTTNAPTALFSSVLLPVADGTLAISTTQNYLSGFAATPNQLAVAHSLDPLTQTPPAGFVPLLTSFNALSANQIGPALEQLTPESLQYSRNIAFENATFLAQRVNGFLGDLRNGYSGLDTNSIGVAAPGFNSGLARSLGSLLAYNSPAFHDSAPNGVNYYPNGGGGSSSPSDSPTPSSSSKVSAGAASPTTYDGQVLSDSPVPMRTSAPPNIRSSNFSEFIGGDVILADLNQNPGMSSKASYTAGDVTAGVAFRMTSNLSVGVLFDYNHTNAKTDSYGSTTTVNSYSPGVFATYFDHNFYANGLFSFGYNTYENTRNIPIAGESATSNPDGQQYVGNLDFGYDIHLNKQNLVVTPTLGVTYTHLDVDSFSESGASTAGLNVNSQSVDSVRSRLGGHILYQTRAGNFLLQPTLTAMWQHEYLNDEPGITSNFQGFSASPFTIQTAAPSKDSALVGCGLTATLDNSMAFYLNYFADVGGNGYLSQSVMGGFKASF